MHWLQTADKDAVGMMLALMKVMLLSSRGHGLGVISAQERMAVHVLKMKGKRFDATNLEAQYSLCTRDT